MEARLALDFLRRGLTRNAAGKAFQAWKALLAALVRLELERLRSAARSEDQRRWLGEKAPLVPTTRMLALSQMLEELGYRGLTYATEHALALRSYQHRGSDPDMELSIYRTREEAAAAVRSMARTVLEYAEALAGQVGCGGCMEAARVLREELAAPRHDPLGEAHQPLHLG